ncbi:hypothetical protein [Cohnella terricola]|uniref:Uncharacterized protein n=1 Tax=Cohnella terricola TaxID=1289167 RepID=A0A559J8P0_9BACL|nr:hypothetical protein [Cohnella terricola]TVX96243.1 hypothetical protein FPZ45_21275 [Cohnella terricola]
MLRCSWCMKKIKENNECLGLGVKFKNEVAFKQAQGTIQSIFLASRNTSVPLIIVADNSEAKKQGQDGIFALCSEKCGVQMKKTLTDETNLFKAIGEMMDLR